MASDTNRSWESQMRKGLLELCVLSVIARGETYGYAILQRLAMAETISTSESTLYPLLNRLVDSGDIRVVTRPSPQGPMRRCYSLSANGEYRLRRMREFYHQQTRDTQSLLKSES